MEEKNISKVIDLEELEAMSLVGGSDDDGASTYSLQTTIITVIVSAMSITQIGTPLSICGHT